MLCSRGRPRLRLKNRYHTLLDLIPRDIQNFCHNGTEANPTTINTIAPESKVTGELQEKRNKNRGSEI